MPIRGVLYDADLRQTATLGAGDDGERTIGDRLRYAGRGEYVIFRVESSADAVIYHAVTSDGWDDQRRAPRAG
jgi:hypothetical protein